MSNTNISSNRLTIMVGITHSGNSTHCASAYPGAIRVSLNAVRLALFGTLDCSKEDNATVILVAKAMVRSLFLAGHQHVALDAMNLSKFHRDFWKDENWTRDFCVMPCDAEISRARIIKNANGNLTPYHKRLLSSLPRMVKNFEMPTQEELEEGGQIYHVTAVSNYL